MLGTTLSTGSASAHGQAAQVAEEAVCSETAPDHAATRAPSPSDASCSSVIDGSAESGPFLCLAACSLF